MPCCSVGDSARLKISTSSIVTPTPKAEPISNWLELERERCRIVGSKVSTSAPSTNSLPPLVLPRATVAATKCHCPSAICAGEIQPVQAEVDTLFAQVTAGAGL